MRRIVLIGILIVGLLSCQQALKVKGFSGANITIDSCLTGDSAMTAEILPYKNDLDKKMNRVIGDSRQELLGYKPESPLSNFVSDIIQQRAFDFLKENNADSLKLVTLINVKGLRAPIPKGKVTVRNIFELMPFENEIVILKLPGDSILSLMNFLGVTEGDGLAGASVVFENNKTKKVTIGGEPLMKTENYYLATSDYLANGGDHYSLIMNPVLKQTVGIRVREAIIAYIEALNANSKKIGAAVEGRIVFN